MRKMLSILLAVMLAVSLAACGDAPESKPQEPEKPDEPAIEEPMAEEEPEVEAEPEDVEVTIPETVLVDEESFKITATALKEHPVFGQTLELLLENKTGRDLDVQVLSASVNGCDVGTVLSVHVPDGTQVTDFVTFIDTDLEENDITEITDLEIAFHIFDADEFETYLESSPVQIKTSAAAQ